MRQNRIFVGLFFILVGIIGIFGKVIGFNIFSMRQLWPLFVLVPGLTFEFVYFSTKKNPGILVPGGILTTIGSLFLFETMTGWAFSRYTWPVYILAVAIGLLQLYLFGGREKGILVPVFILGGIAIISFCKMVFGGIFWWLGNSIIIPIGILIIGLAILLKKN